MGLKPEEITRYSRQISLREWGEARQERLSNARVLVIGAGGLGSPALLYLAAAGVGHLGFAEPDRVDLSNLQRQILFETKDVGKLKSEAASKRLSALNPEIEILTHQVRAGEDNIDTLIASYDVVIDATDGFDARYSIHDACFRARKPYVYGAVDRFEGRVGVFFHQEGPCCRCLFPASSFVVQSCAEAGVLGVLPGLIGTLQATEALKIISGVGETLSGKLLLYEALSASFRAFEVNKNPECPLCGVRPKLTRSTPRAEVSALGLQERLRSHEPLCLIDIREGAELAQGVIAGAIHIPLSELEKSLPRLDANLETVVYCQRGRRSTRALEMLRNAGFANVRHLEGGFSAFREILLP